MDAVQNIIKSWNTLDTQPDKVKVVEDMNGFQGAAFEPQRIRMFEVTYIEPKIQPPKPSAIAIKTTQSVELQQKQQKQANQTLISKSTQGIINITQISTPTSNTSQSLQIQAAAVPSEPPVAQAEVVAPQEATVGEAKTIKVAESESVIASPP